MRVGVLVGSIFVCFAEMAFAENRVGIYSLDIEAPIAITYNGKKLRSCGKHADAFFSGLMVKGLHVKYARREVHVNGVKWSLTHGAHGNDIVAVEPSPPADTIINLWFGRTAEGGAAGTLIYLRVDATNVGVCVDARALSGSFSEGLND